MMPMAEILEQCEQIEEEEVFRQQGIYRRDHSHSRDSFSHFSKPPFDKTSDPWYVSDCGDIIDAPRIGSLLSYSEILSMLENASPMVKRIGVVRFYAREGEVVPVQEAESAEISLGSLYSWTDQAVSELESSEDQLHLFVRVAIDRDMLRHNNRLLTACCLS